MNAIASEPDFTIEPQNRLLSFACRHVAREIHPENIVTFVSEVDLTEIECFRAQAAAIGKERPSYTTFVVKAVALALKEFPYANRRVCRRGLFGWRFQRFNRIDVAVACERKLEGTMYAAFVDVLRDADRVDIQSINSWLHALATSDESNNKQWREFRWAIFKLPTVLSVFFVYLQNVFSSLWVKYRGGAVLISSPAKYGVDTVLTTWPWPLGISFGLVKLRPVVRGGRVVARPTFMLTLSFDRRMMVGAPAARFFRGIIDILEGVDKNIGDSTAQTPQSAVIGSHSVASDERADC